MKFFLSYIAKLVLLLSNKKFCCYENMRHVLFDWYFILLYKIPYYSVMRLGYVQYLSIYLRGTFNKFPDFFVQI